MITTAAVFLAITLALAAIPLSSISSAELDVQVYEGEGAVGIVVSESNSGFDVSLDDNSTVIVSGDNVSSSDVVGGGPIDNGVNSTEPAVDNSSTSTDEGIINCITVPCGPFGGDNQTVISDVEVPHIGTAPTDIGTYNGTDSNITSSTDMIDIITGGNLTTGEEEVVDIGGNVTDVVGNGTSVIGGGGTDNSTTTSENVNDVITQGLGCLNGDELRKLIILLSLFNTTQ